MGFEKLWVEKLWVQKLWVEKLWVSKNDGLKKLLITKLLIKGLDAQIRALGSKVRGFRVWVKVVSGVGG